MSSDSGGQYEKLIENILKDHSVYNFEVQYNLGKKESGQGHRADVFLIDTKEVISLKTQTVNGTSEQKIPYEVLTLQHAVNEGNCKSATIVLHGDGWGEKKWYLSEGFCSKMNCPDIKIIDHDNFVNEYTDLTICRNDRGLEKFFGDE